MNEWSNRVTETMLIALVSIAVAWVVFMVVCRVYRRYVRATRRTPVAQEAWRFDDEYHQAMKRKWSFYDEEDYEAMERDDRNGWPPQPARELLHTVDDSNEPF
jgi:hypothetical protein